MARGKREIKTIEELAVLMTEGFKTEGAKIDKKIDRLIYNLYNLDEQEIKIVDSFI